MKCNVIEIPDFSQSVMALHNVCGCPLDKILFFDIETTGLSARSSYLYLIGCAYYSSGRFYLKQWFLENPSEEKETLIRFYHFMRSYDVLIHFNGTTFDMPYILHKWQRYALPYDFSGIESIDLYKLLLPYKTLLGLPNLKQKTLEDFLKRTRKDPFDGGQLIAVYQEYLTTHDPRGLACLLLHNKEDVEGLTALPAMLTYGNCLRGEFDFKSAQVTEGHTADGTPCFHLDLCLQSRLPFPVPVTYQKNAYYLKMSGTQMVITETSPDGMFHKYYGNYKDYCYLPVEDTIIPKSMAAGISKDRKRPATKATCYSRFFAGDEFLRDPNAVSAYAVSLSDFLMTVK